MCACERGAARAETPLRRPRRGFSPLALSGISESNRVCPGPKPGGLAISLIPAEQGPGCPGRDCSLLSVGIAGFEPATSRPRTERSAKLSHIPLCLAWSYGDLNSGLPGANRVLYQTELHPHCPALCNYATTLRGTRWSGVPWSYADLNRGPLQCHCSALPAELQPHGGAKGAPRCERDAPSAPADVWFRLQAARQRCSRCGETDRGFFRYVRANPAVFLPAKVAVVAEDLVIRRKTKLDDGQVKHGAATHRFPMSTTPAIHVIQGQEAAIGLSTASAVRAVTVQYLVLEAIMVSPPPAANPIRISCHLSGTASSRLSLERFFIASVVSPLVFSTSSHVTTVLEDSLLSSQYTSTFTRRWCCAGEEGFEPP